MVTGEKRTHWLLLAAVFAIATCGLIYELVAGTLASYLLGDSVKQFSTIIGVYLFAMGIGSFLSRYFQRQLLSWFVRIELMVGLVGGFSATILFICFPIASGFGVILYGLIGLTGVLVGLEIPLLMRILKDRMAFDKMVSQVFSFDYIGALAASILFPLLLVPQLGLIRTSLFFGMINLGIGIYLAFHLRRNIKRAMWLQTTGVVLLLTELIAFAYANQIMDISESLSYNDRVVYSASTLYQRIAITKNKKELRLFLNGNLQFSSIDEYRYHEALVHPALSAMPTARKVLVLGGGDGLAVREIIKYPGVEKIQLVDLDPAMTRLFSTQGMLTAINQLSLRNKKLHIENADAFSWLRSNNDRYDAVIVDFPDPSNFSIGKLYSVTFYKYLMRALTPAGIAVIQSTSPFVAPKSFWCIDTTLKTAGFETLPYHNYVPSFGEWGYVMAMKNRAMPDFRKFPANLRYLDSATMQQMMVFPPDMKAKIKPLPNKLNNQHLVNYFEEEWSEYLDQ